MPKPGIPRIWQTLRFFMYLQDVYTLCHDLGLHFSKEFIFWPKYGAGKRSLSSPLFSTHLLSSENSLRWLNFPPVRQIKLLQAKLKDIENYQWINTNTYIPSPTRLSEWRPACNTLFFTQSGSCLTCQHWNAGMTVVTLFRLDNTTGTIIWSNQYSRLGVIHKGSATHCLIMQSVPHHYRFVDAFLSTTAILSQWTIDLRWLSLSYNMRTADTV